jgi:plasmid stabilization system protein ParE
MAYLVRLTDRALRDLETLYERIQAESSEQANSWFNGLVEAIYSLEQQPERATRTTENRVLRQLLYGGKRNTYRIIFKVRPRARVVDILHVRHGSRAPFGPKEIL